MGHKGKVSVIKNYQRAYEIIYLINIRPKTYIKVFLVGIKQYF